MVCRTNSHPGLTVSLRPGGQCVDIRGTRCRAAPGLPIMGGSAAAGILHRHLCSARPVRRRVRRRHTERPCHVLGECRQAGRRRGNVPAREPIRELCRRGRGGRRIFAREIRDPRRSRAADAFGQSQQPAGIGDHRCHSAGRRGRRRIDRLEHQRRADHRGCVLRGCDARHAVDPQTQGCEGACQFRCGRQRQELLEANRLVLAITRFTRSAHRHGDLLGCRSRAAIFADRLGAG